MPDGDHERCFVAPRRTRRVGDSVATSHTTMPSLASLALASFNPHGDHASAVTGPSGYRKYAIQGCGDLLKPVHRQMP